MRLVIFSVAVGIFFVPYSAIAAILINEIAWMGTAQDPNGSYCEWIELYNTSPSTAVLDDWVLSFGTVSISFASVSLVGNGYFVLERYTENACPDPVPTVSDFSTSFGNGLPNGGTTIVLKRADGGTEDQVAGGADWKTVGGDNATKETAQRTASGWVTAEGTPGAENASRSTENLAPVEDTGEEESTNQTVSKASGDTAERSPVKSIKIIAPKIAYVNQPVEFDVTPSGSGDRLVRYIWNFGDTEMAEGKTPTHTFKHSGMYVVVAESRYLKETAEARAEITVLPTALSLARTVEGHLQVHNNAKYEIDLEGFVIRGEKEFTIPRNTVLLASATLTIHRSLFESGPRSLVSVHDPAGTTLVSLLAHETGTEDLAHEETDEILEARAVSADMAEESEETFDTAFPAPVSETLENPEEPMVYRPNDAAVVEAAQGQSFNAILSYIGLLVVLILGIVGLYVRRDAAKTE